MRVLAVDVGRRRIGLAISDTSALLARPLVTLDVGRVDPVERVAAEIERLVADEDGLAAIVVGMPTRLDGSPGEQTVAVERFIDRLASRVTVPIVAQDERLTSREAEEVLAIRERDWRKRKAKLDAMAATVILQEYLDGQRGT